MMKNLTNLGLAIILILVNGLAATAWGDQVFTHNVATTLDELSISQTANGARYVFDPVNVTDIDGAPEIPYKVVKLVLPSDTKVISVEAVGSDFSSIAEGVDLSWCEGDIKTDILESYVPAQKNRDVYSSNNLMPGKYVELINSGYMGSQHLATIAVYPVQYRPASGEIVLVRNIEIEINLQDNHVLLRSANNNNDADLLVGLVDNPDDLPSQGPMIATGSGPIPGSTTMGLGAEYLVITSGELAPAFYPFVVWKNQKGLLTEIVLIEDILARYSGVDDAERLREYLKEAYAAGAKWVLLGGDETIIPIRYAYPGNVSAAQALRYEQVTDLYFADLTGDWNADGDQTWGEYLQDSPDIFPEVYVGRVPVKNQTDIEVWVNKEIMYETNPNNGDFDYLTRGLFITADQMRDLNEHTQLASAMPANFEVDYSRCAEEPSGGAAAPTQPTGETIRDVMSEGWGFVSNLNHGGFYYYGAMTPGYNGNPRSDFFGDTLSEGNGTSSLSRLDESDKYGIHYSISCYTAAYDFDQEVFWPGPFITNNSFMEAYLFLPNKGGVAFLGNTRWGWVSSSFQLEKKFIDYVFADTSRNIAVAEALSKIYYPTKRDIGYGHNVFGDPELKIWARTPMPLTMSVPQDLSLDAGSFTVQVNDNNGPASGMKVTVWKPGELYMRGTTDSEGHLEIPVSLAATGDMYVTAIGQDYLPVIDTVHVFLQSKADEENLALPEVTYLASNYPNPFNARTEIKFGLSADGHVSLDIYDIGGRKIKTLVDGSMTAGVHSINWNSRNDSGDLVASGTYFYKLTTDTDNMVKKMVLLK
jgi:hypothetical protein